MTTATALDALDALGSLTTPHGESWADAWQRDPWIVDKVLKPILERKLDGTPRYRICWIELARGHAKTSLVAGVGLIAALGDGGVNAFCLATDSEQAAFVLEALDGQQRRNPMLAAHLKQTAARLTVKRNGSYVRVMASDVPSGFGLAPDARRVVFILDEVTQWPSRAMYDMAMTTIPKIADAQLIVITNAGVKDSWQAKAREQVAALAAKGKAHMFAATGTIASWLRPEDLALAEASVPPAVYARFYGNVWTDSAGGFISRDDLARCIDDAWRPQLGASEDQAARYFYAVDLGLTKDRTARAVVHFDREAQRVVLDSLRVWQGRKGDPVLIADIEADMAQCHAAFRSPVMLADPWQMQATIQKLSGQYRLREFTFSAEHVRRLSENLYSMIHNGQLRLYPDDELEAELLGLEVKQTSYGWRIDHQSRGFSDRAMALGMAALEAVSERPKRQIRVVA